MMAGNITAICFGAMAAVIVSLCTRGRMTAEEVEAEWEKTRDIDNPLNPRQSGTGYETGAGAVNFL